MKRLGNYITTGTTAGMALLAVALLCSFDASAQAGKKLPGETLDPISFRAPDPSKRFKDIYIEQKREEFVPLELEFTDETGQTVQLKEYFNGKPVVLGLVYYECPSFCNVILQNMVISFDAAANKLNLGDDYIALAVSIDPGETPEIAAAKKEEILDWYHRDNGDTGFRFLTGSAENIETLASAVGYRYFYDESTDQYAHAGGIMILTPEGQISSYYLGTEYLPKKLQFALMDAAEGLIGPLMDQFVALCFAYDPSTGAYGFYIINAIRLFGGLTVGAVAVFIIGSILAERAKAKRNQEQGTPSGNPASSH